MASPCESVICGVPWAVAAEASKAVESEVRRIESKYSRFTPDGVVGRRVLGEGIVRRHAAVVEDAVNAVGVDLNTASAPLLARVSGLGKSSAEAIVVAAGMEGALASVIGGLTSVPVVAIPTSVGYGAGLDAYLAATLRGVRRRAGLVSFIILGIFGYAVGNYLTGVPRRIAFDLAGHGFPVMSINTRLAN